MAFKFGGQDENDLNTFLAKVDDLEKIVKGFKSADINEQNDAMTKADDMLKKESTTTFDKTVINDKAYENEDAAPSPGMQFTTPDMSQEAFMSALEADANQRAKARKEREERAGKIKHIANEAFRQGDFDTAVKLYSDAISTCKDMIALYTNRAMAYIKLGKFGEAIEDCDFAKKIDITWAKAYILKGNALRAMKKYDEAVQSYKEILEHHKHKEKLVEDYVKETTDQQQADELEIEARKGLENRDPTSNLVAQLVHLLGTRVRPKCETKGITFASNTATIKMLAGQIEDDLKAQVLFRQEGGFKILAAQPFLRDSLLQKNFEIFEQSDFAQSMLVLIQAACSKCPQNTLAFFEEPKMTEMMLNLVMSTDRQVKHAAIVCFHEFASSAKAIEHVSELFTVPRLLQCLLNKDVFKLKLLQLAVLTINRYAENDRFRVEALPVFDTHVLKYYHQFIDEIGHNQRKDLPLCIASLCIFLRTKRIQKLVAMNEKLWNSCIMCLEKIIQVFEPNDYREELLSKMLDLAEYLLLVECETTVKIAPLVANCILPAVEWKFEHNAMKIVTTLTRCLERTKECVRIFETASGIHFVKKIYKLIKSDDAYTRSNALKIICHCGQTRTSTLKNIPKFDKKYAMLREVLLLNECDLDLFNQGHAAILFGFLSHLPGGMDPLMENPDDLLNVVKYLLELARHAKKDHTRYNCVIALGKMANNDPRVLGEVKRLDGINILSKNKPPDV